MYYICNKNLEPNLKERMSFFKNVFGNEKEDQVVSNQWIALVDFGQLNEIIALSHEKTILIFKHSTRCSISKMALKEVEKGLINTKRVMGYYLDLLNYRSISNEIATRYDIEHKSPQVLLIKDGKVHYTASHEMIDSEIISTKL
jgi:bacillithiol system protein YtxJ